MAYNAPSSRSTSDLITAAIWNADVVANPIAIYAGAMSVSSQAVGDILYASSTTQLGRIAAVATGQVLTSAGTGTVPAWSSNVDLGGTLDVTGATTLDSTLAVSSTAADAIDVAGGITAGTGNVALVGTDGKINGPLSSTIIDDLSGANLTTLNASNISSGTLANARLPTNVDLGGTLDVTGATKLDGAFEVSGHTFLDGTLSIGYLNSSLNKILIGGPYTSPGTSSYAQVVAMSTALTSVTGDTSWAVGVNIGPSITTQASETIADVASVVIAEPEITKGASGAAVTRASTLWIRSAPTEGVSNYALYVADGVSQFNGQVNAERYHTAVSAAISTDGTTNLYASAGASGAGGGMIAMRDGYGRFGLFWYGSYSTLTKLAGNAVFSATKDNASTINIYYESGNIVYQNKTTIASLSVHYTRILD